MTAPTFSASSLQWVGIAPDTSYGVAAAAPTLYVPVEAPQLTPNQNTLLDKNLRGAMAGEYAQVPGMRHDTFTFKTDVYLSSVFAFLRAVLGYPDVLSGSAAPYTHKTALQNKVNGQPAGTTVFYSDGNKTYIMPGAIASDVKVTIKSDDVATLDVTYMGLPSTEAAPLTNTPDTTLPMASWNTTITVGGTAFTEFSEIILDFKRTVAPVVTITGTQAPYAIAAGELTLQIDFTGVFQGSTDVNWVNYLTGAQTAVVAKIAPIGDAVNSVTFQMSKVAYSAATFTPGAEYFEVKATGRALANATDALDGVLSPAQVVMLSPVSTAI